MSYKPEEFKANYVWKLHLGGYGLFDDASKTYYCDECGDCDWNLGYASTLVEYIKLVLEDYFYGAEDLRRTLDKDDEDHDLMLLYDIFRQEPEYVDFSSNTVTSEPFEYIGMSEDVILTVASKTLIEMTLAEQQEDEDY